MCLLMVVTPVCDMNVSLMVVTHVCGMNVSLMVVFVAFGASGVRWS